MRLQEGDVQVDVGRHLRRDVEGIARIFPVFYLYPFAAEHGRAVFDGYQRMSSGGGGDEGGSFVTRFIRLLIQRESQHLHVVGVGLGGASTPLRPVDVDGATRGMSAFLILDIDEVAPPFGIVDAEGEAGFSRLGLQLTAGNRRDGAVVDVGAERFLAVLPPPAPIHLIYFILQLGAIRRFAVGRQRDDVEAMLRICLDAKIIRLIQGDTYVGGERRIGNTLHVDAGVSARFVDAGGEGGVQHTRRCGSLRKFPGEGSSSVGIQLSVE